MVPSHRERVADLPPSAKLVYTVLAYNGTLTQKQIAEESLLSPRTVRYALERLEEHQVVEADIYFADARQHLYRLVADPTAADGTSESAQCAE